MKEKHGAPDAATTSVSAKSKENEEYAVEKEAQEIAAPFPMAHVSEVWLNVFQKLEPQDKPNFHRPCEEWHELVGRRRTQFLLSEVLPMLIEPLKEHETLLKCRELCQSWTQAVDYHIQTHPSQLRLAFETDSCIGGIGCTNYQTKFYQHTCQEVKIQGFLDDMKNHQGNPFPGKYIYFGFHYHPSEQEPGLDICRKYWSKVIELLVKFGKYVHNVWFGADVSYCLLPYLEMELILRNCLLHMSHLRRLNTGGHGHSNVTGDEVRNLFQINPLPLLENLETVQIYDCGSAAMIEAVLSSCCVPSKIKRANFFDNSEDFRGIAAACKFSNLEFLATDLYIQDLEMFRSLERQPPLEKLSLALKSAEITAEQLFSAFEPVAGTLEYLKICYHYENKLVLDPEDVKINFPNLERLEVDS